MKNIKFKFNLLVNSKLYPFILFLSVLVSHSLSIELFGATVIIAFSILGFLFCDDLKFLISPLVFFIFIFSEKSVASGIFYTKPYLIAIGFVSVLLISLIIYFFIKHKDNFSIKRFISSKLFLGYALLSCSFLCNGLFNFNEYEIGNIIFAVALIASIGFIYFFFYSFLKTDESLKDYILYVLYLTSILITLQLYIGYLGQFAIDNGKIIKESIKLGWGMWNNIGGMLAFLLPVHFYFATKSHKLGVLFYFSGIVSYLAIVLTLSRSSLLTATFIIIICALISCFKGTNKKANRIITASIFILGICGIIVLWNKISVILGDYLARGFDDNGRFEIYEHGILNFLDNPIFGGGFSSCYVLEHQFIAFLPYRYHNTIIQMMATCGIFGLVSYIIHRYQTIKLILSKRSLFSLFSGLCILSMLLCSLLDNHFFNLYPSFIYSLLLVIIEKTE